MALARSVATLSLLVLALAIARPATAACPGDCSADLAANPKTVEKYVKQRWKAVTACGKRGEPACPSPCPVPDATAEPYNLAPACRDLLDCNLDAMAEAAYDATWDAAAFCPLALASTCGNARAAGTGKLVVKKLKRRRTSKMDKFPKDLATCVAKVDKAGACDGALACGATGLWIDAIFPVGLGKGGFQRLPFSVASVGEGVGALTLAADTVDWGLLGRESVVVEYDVDGTVMGTIVVYDGAEPAAYTVLLGDLAAGDHVIGLRHKNKLSPASDAPVSILAAPSVEAISQADARYDFTRFAPVLLGLDADLNQVSAGSGLHPGNAVSDVPLIVYAKPIPGAGITTYRYVMIWSNEDGGTGQFPDLLVARYGRATDIETIVEVDVTDAGGLAAVRYRPDESGSLASFAGAFRGTHPIVRTATANGLIADDGDSTLQFAIAPVEFDDSGLPRELGMDLLPVSYVVMAKEMIREDKIEAVGDAGTKKLSDLRHYLYVDYDIDVDVGGQVLRGVAVVDGTSYYSDHALPFNLALNPRVSDGVGRLAIELPPGTTIGDVEQYGMQGIGSMSGTLFSLDAFMLENDFLPGTHLSFSGALVQAGTDPSWLVTP